VSQALHVLAGPAYALPFVGAGQPPIRGAYTARHGSHSAGQPCRRAAMLPCCCHATILSVSSPHPSPHLVPYIAARSLTVRLHNTAVHAADLLPPRNGTDGRTVFQPASDLTQPRELPLSAHSPLTTHSPPSQGMNA
jgi:hypothetical protein